MLLIVDNYDSFTWNLYQLACELGAAAEVVRNDATDLAGLDAYEPDALLVSPGPGNPSQAGISSDAIRHFAGRIPVLGVCLGMQCIGEVYGGRVVRAGELRHGKTSTIHHHSSGVFSDVPNPFTAVRYHSLVVERETLPDVLEATAETDNGLLMGLRHRQLDVEGVQFHPESIATEHGSRLLANFLARSQ